MAEERGSAAARGYGSRWQKAREGYLAKHPWCVKCAAQKRQVLATVVDHVTPHRGDMQLFWLRANWQGLCEAHHNSTKQRQERSGFEQGCDVAGRPVDPHHPWNRSRSTAEGAGGRKLRAVAP